MEYAYATLLVNETGAELNEENLTAVLEAAGCDVEESRVKALVAALEGVEVDDVGEIDVGEVTNASDDVTASASEDRTAPSGDGEPSETSEELQTDESAAER